MDFDQYQSGQDKTGLPYTIGPDGVVLEWDPKRERWFVAMANLEGDIQETRGAVPIRECQPPPPPGWE